MNIPQTDKTEKLDNNLCPQKCKIIFFKLKQVSRIFTPKLKNMGLKNKYGYNMVIFSQNTRINTSTLATLQWILGLPMEFSGFTPGSDLV